MSFKFHHSDLFFFVKAFLIFARLDVHLHSSHNFKAPNARFAFGRDRFSGRYESLAGSDASIWRLSAMLKNSPQK